MNYPFWDVDIGYGIIMPIVAIIHVFVSHFAIGGGLYLVVAETAARKAADQMRLEFLQKLSKFFVLVTVVFGALTGVGIWFTIGLLSPGATEVLIHNFVWGWAIEWTFFVMEILAALLYYYGWKTMSARNHLIVGWIYFVAAWLSLFVINGIVTFMLTPGEWITTGEFWDGFFNPTFWSSLVLRTGICIALAGLYALLVASRYPASDFKARTVRYNAVWGIIGMAIALPSLLWYKADIPADLLETAMSSITMPVSALSQWWLYAAILGGGFVVFGLLVPRAYHTAIAVIMLVVGLLWFGSYEWFRESVRKPYVISEYMYANALEVKDIATYEEEGLLPHIEFRTGNDGADLFRHTCRSCHTMDGYRPLKPAFDGADQEFITSLVRYVEVLKGNMPPFPGIEEEARMVAAHIYSKTDHRHLSEIYNLEGVELGKKVYDVRCGACHVIGGFNDKWESIVGLEREDYEVLLDMAGDLAEEMPPFTGDEKEREALIEFFMTLKEGGAQ